jgi:hypothetical protein
MGLDMYLEKRTYVRQWSHQTPEEQYNVEVTKGGQPVKIDPKRVTYVIEEIGYWRKQNQIHQWFVENVQNGVDNCGEYCVSKGQLEDLLEICNKILNDNSLAEELLPTASGFFFGGTEYDEWYFDGIENTIEILKEALSDTSADYYYSSSW